MAVTGHKNQIYIGATHQYYSVLPRNLLSYLVLFYDRILVPMEVRSFEFMPSPDEWISARFETLRSASIADHWLSRWCDYKKKDFDVAVSIMEGIPHSWSDPVIDDFFDYLLNVQRQQHGDSFHLPVFHSQLFELLVEHFPFEDSISRQEAFSALYDFLVGSLISKRYRYNRVMSEYEAYLTNLLQSSPHIFIDKPDPQTGNLNILRRWFDVSTVNEIASWNVAGNDDPFDIFSCILELEVPQLESVPIKELVNFRKSRKIAPLVHISMDWAENRSKDMSISEIRDRVQDALWNLVRELWPSAKSDLIGAIGTFPTGPIPVNPIGVIAWLKDFRTHRQIRKKYSWIMTISQMQELTRKTIQREHA